MGNYIYITYLIYLLTSLYVTIWVGYKLYKLGEVFLFEMFKTNMDIVKPLNVMLLVGYYLLNIGYVLILLINKNSIATPAQFFENLSSKIGTIILTLGVIHILNLTVFLLINHYQSKSIRSI
ncbi:MAG: hypothetical protein RLZZ175_2879 [Bacteroidota bacterium]|jgi:hypothetical protein